MVHVNSKYLNDDGTVDPVAYQTPDGLAVLGFMFKVKSSEVTIIYNNMFCIEHVLWEESVVNQSPSASSTECTSFTSRYLNTRSIIVTIDW